MVNKSLKFSLLNLFILFPFCKNRVGLIKLYLVIPNFLISKLLGLIFKYVRRTRVNMSLIHYGGKISLY